jgi:RimJ/RimL family protein N-acetyltransferase
VAYSIVQGWGVVEWVSELTRSDIGCNAKGIGLLKDGVLVAGAAYDKYNGRNIFVHQRIDAKPTKAYWRAIASYPFEDLGCSRMTVTVEASNAKSLKLVTHLGFVEEARLSGAAGDGGDFILLVLWKENCKLLDWKIK